MSLLQSILMWLSLVAAGVLSVIGFAVWCDQHQVFPGRRLLGAFRRLPWPVQFFLLAFSLHLIVHGSIKTNAVDDVEGAAQQRGRGVRHAPYEIPQPEAGRVPAAAELAQNWWRRGCWEDWRTVTFEDGWVFPRGSNHLSQVVVMSQGEILASVCDTLSLASLGTRVAHVPFDTCFYHEHTPSNSYRFVWDRAYTERNTNMPMTAAVELFRNGDTCVTTNGVSTVMPYEIPFPHVGIGQDDDWVRANFTNATDILAVGYADWVDVQVGVDLTNGLYKFTATFPDDPPEATELVVGDLSVCVTNAGEYVFVLEKGVEYDFGTNPYDATVEYSMQDDLMDAPVFANGWWFGDGNGVWTVDGGWQWISTPTIWGFGYCFWEPKFHGSPDVSGFCVSDFPMTFEAVLSDCVRTNGVVYHWSSDSENVNILSPDAQTTQVEVDSSVVGESISLSVEAHMPDRTYYSTLSYRFPTNDASGISLSMPDTIFVNNDDDNDDGVLDCDRRILPAGLFDRDDDVVNASVGLPEGGARKGTLLLADKDGFDGTIYDAAVENDYVGLGSEWEIEPGMASPLSLEVSGSVASEGYRSSRLKFRWMPDEGDEKNLIRRFTVVEPVVEPICSVCKTVYRDGIEHELAYNPSGVVIGKNAYFRISVAPDDYPDSKIVWRALGEGVVEFVGDNTGREVCVRGVSEGNVTLEIDIGGCSAERPTFPVRVVENVSVKISVCIFERDGEAMREVSDVREMLGKVNDIFEQMGMSFYIDSIVMMNIPEACEAVFSGPTQEGSWCFDDVAHVLPDSNGLKCYFIDSFVDSLDTIAGNDKNGMLLTKKANARSWAHEIGHACGLDDIYVSRSGRAIPVTESFEWRHAMDDWNNGSVGDRTIGSRYYLRNKTHVEAVKNLLMYGYNASTALDISRGDVEGVVKIDDETSYVGYSRTGMLSANVTRMPEHKRKELANE